jgi:L-ascorbate metabolism protein UlaG (beta-lactamase superfamily)
MKRRQFIQNTSTGLFTALGLEWMAQQQSPAQAQDILSITWLGHTCCLFVGGGQRVLVNPFQAVGCTAGYLPPNVETDYVLISSRQLDEGASEMVPGSPRVFFEPGAYRLQENNQIQGIRTQHDRIEGQRYGQNVAWRWSQAGVQILHLGGIASTISTRQKILMGAPDVLLIPVGGKQPPNGTSKYDPAWPEVYTPQEAKQTIELLSPRIVIPTHYRTEAADAALCDLVGLQEFLQIMTGTPVNYSSDNILALSSQNLPEQSPLIQVMGYQA